MASDWLKVCDNLCAKAQKEKVMVPTEGVEAKLMIFNGLRDDAQTCIMTP